MAEYGLLGAKLSHSFSKDIHEQIADYEYELIEMTPEELDCFLKEKNFKAVNVTIPYKQTVIPYLDEMTEAARTIGAVNCIRNEEGRLIGHNTDFDGMKGLINYMGLELAGKKVLILGTGGTSDTAIAVCKALGVQSVTKVSRGKKAGTVPYEEAKALHRDAQVIINTTPCGMYPKQYESPIELDGFDKLEGVIDVVYNPIRTQLVSEALSLGIKAEGGLYMLIEQAVRASEFFLNTKYCAHVTDNVFADLYSKKQNIVLTGMPASGKTTVGKILGKTLKRPFYDTDVLIERKTEMKISEIFEKYGEEYFRNLETEVIKEVSMRNGVVIATGGGAVLRPENVRALKLNGKIFFRDRDPEKLIPTKNRPTASTVEQIMKRYEERYPIYTSTCDYIVTHQHTAQGAAEEIIKEL
ncbi:MAG: shikimate dehydrogenase [Firmicutes bacterium]|nr:shikimate dehydrogenase [Bacillota bacterium]